MNKKHPRKVFLFFWKYCFFYNKVKIWTVKFYQRYASLLKVLIKNENLADQNYDQ